MACDDIGLEGIFCPIGNQLRVFFVAGFHKTEQF